MTDLINLTIQPSESGVILNISPPFEFKDYDDYKLDEVDDFMLFAKTEHYTLTYLSHYSNNGDNIKFVGNKHFAPVCTPDVCICCDANIEHSKSDIPLDFVCGKLCAFINTVGCKYIACLYRHNIFDAKIETSTHYPNLIMSLISIIRFARVHEIYDKLYSIMSGAMRKFIMRKTNVREYPADWAIIRLLCLYKSDDSIFNKQFIERVYSKLKSMYDIDILNLCEMLKPDTVSNFMTYKGIIMAKKRPRSRSHSKSPPKYKKQRVVLTLPPAKKQITINVSKHKKQRSVSPPKLVPDDYTESKSPINIIQFDGKNLPDIYDNLKTHQFDIQSIKSLDSDTISTIKNVLQYAEMQRIDNTIYKVFLDYINSL